jgi:hypothetical protein
MSWNGNDTAMQLFNALLAGFFLWLTLFVHFRRSVVRKRQWAGELLLLVKPVCGRWNFTSTLLWLICFCVFALRGIANILIFHRYCFETYFCIALITAAVIFIFTIRSENVAFEVRRRGLVCGMQGGFCNLIFLCPWYKKKKAKWIIPAFQNAGWGCLRLQEKLVSPEDKAAVTAAVGRFLPVYDWDDTLLAQPEPTGDEKQNREPGKYHFQFDLQTLLIFFAAVACLANCYGLEKHRMEQHDAAVAELQKKYHPRIERGPIDESEIRAMDFSSRFAKSKPTDADMDDVAFISELGDLNLSNTPITDAGLEKIEKLKYLSSITLRGTAVTDAGVKRLQEALPNAKIIR